MQKCFLRIEVFAADRRGMGCTMSDPKWDSEDEMLVEPDDATADARLRPDERDSPDAERVLREAGGDADRAEDIIENRRLDRDKELGNVPADERPVI
jgi:hypothetical protein